MTQVTAIQTDITRLTVDAVVNAANSSLLGGGGVDGAIHRAAGRQLKAACADLGGCQPGSAKSTPGFAMPAKWIIHTVGPIWKDGQSGEPETLRQCYVSCLNEAWRLKATRIAFPAISCGVYGFPIAHASRIAVDTVMDYIAAREIFDEIVFCCFSEEAQWAYRQALALHAL